MKRNFLIFKVMSFMNLQIFNKSRSNTNLLLFYTLCSKGQLAKTNHENDRCKLLWV